jgi:adenylosuccinate synthase
MTSHAVIGIQWGDEGKGKITDRLAESADLVARCQGGNNAGHTVVIGEDRFILNLIPSGILHPECKNLIGNGVVVDLDHLFGEIESLEHRGISVEGRLFVSALAHLILPLHRKFDKLVETLKDKGRIGTTGRGIGPTYADKAARIGVRVCDILVEEQLRTRVDSLLEQQNPILTKVFGEEPIDPDQLFEDLRARGRRLEPFVCDCGRMVREAYRRGDTILFEGAQGAMLDLDAGTYPYVTSSNATVSGICAGIGLPPAMLDRVIGVSKAYTTRVGSGPFPTELMGERGEELRRLGKEYGATTGRPRRCGWFDVLQVRYAAELNGVDEIVITNLDVLSGFGELRVAVGYKVGGREFSHFPAEIGDLSRVEPIYESLEGWDEDLSQAKSLGELPRAARNYIEFLEKMLDVPIAQLSVGPERSQVIPRAV